MKSPILLKNDFLFYNVFLWKEERSFQTWEDGNDWPASKTRFAGWYSKNRNQFLKYWLFSAKRHVTCHVTFQKYQFYLKNVLDVKTYLCAKSGRITIYTRL